MSAATNFLRVGLGSLAALCLATGIGHSSPKNENLLLNKELMLDRTFSSGIDQTMEALLRDGDDQTGIQIETKKGEPVELVFYFGGQTVSPNGIKLKTSDIDKDQAKIEILASTLSASTGFSSLRTEPIRKTDNWQRFAFEQAAAKWIMIKIVPFKAGVTFSIAELEINGHVGAPVTAYKFDESPADAIAVLSRLDSSIEVGVTEDEASLFEDAKDGTLDDWSFAEASLLSSGVYDANKRDAYLTEIDALEAAARKAVPKNADSFEKGRALLGWLHKNVFRDGYIEGQTDMSRVLSTRTYNCVSSATLYNILARRMGLDARGIEVPDHAFSILYEGTKHADIETTTKAGFNPARNRAALSEFARKTGFVYINDKNRSKRREIGEAGMVALTYYNHGVEYSKKKQYHKALLNYFRALSLDPANKSSVKNALAVLVNWSAELLKKNDFDGAVKILETGLELAPNDRTIRHNTKVVWQRKVEQDIQNGDIRLALASLKSAFEKTDDKSFLRMQSWIYQKQGERQIEKGDWDAALALADEGLTTVVEAAQKDLKRWRSGIILRWSNSAMKSKDFTTAVQVLERGLNYGGPSYKIKNNLAYAAQEWAAHVRATKGSDASRGITLALAKRFPDLKGVQRAVSRGFDVEARKAASENRFEEAITLYSRARQERADDQQLKKNEQITWDMWAKTFFDSKDWKAALDIYEKAHAAYPKASLFKQNIAYAAQEWSRTVATEGDPVKAEELLALLAKRFPDVRNVSRMRGKIIGAKISALVKAEKHEEAARLLPSSKPYFGSTGKYKNLAVYVYYQWADQFSRKRHWQDAVAIYALGYENHPDNSKMKRNLIATWHGWAKDHMDKEEWQKAVGVYERGLIAVPNTSLFKRNIKYCKKKLGDG